MAKVFTSFMLSEHFLKLQQVWKLFHMKKIVKLVVQKEI
jgi:hypothetical protein